MACPAVINPEAQAGAQATAIPAEMEAKAIRDLFREGHLYREVLHRCHQAPRHRPCLTLQQS